MSHASALTGNELVPIPVPGADDLMATQSGGRRWAALKPMCDSLGIDTWTQQRKLNSKSWATTSVMTVVAADGKSREMAMIDSRTIPMWLATIDENKVNVDSRLKLIAYQREAADALDAYFNEGGAINPRATEDQIDRIARQAKAHAAVLTALKGIVDSKHLEAKGRLVLARALGEAPEIDVADMPLYVSDYLKAKGLSNTLVTAKASGFGKRLKARYIVDHDRAPERHHQELPNGTIREVCAYTEADRPLFDSVWARHYANVVAESALMVLPGGSA